MKLDQKQVGVDHPKYATHRANLATVQEAQKNLAAAEQGYLEAVRVYEQVLGRVGHPNLIDTYANLGTLLAKTGNFATAKDHLCKALGLNQQLRGAGHTLVGNDHANLGYLYYATGDKSGGVRAVQEGAGDLPGQRQVQAAAEEASLHRASADRG